MTAVGVGAGVGAGTGALCRGGNGASCTTVGNTDACDGSAAVEGVAIDVEATVVVDTLVAAVAGGGGVVVAD